MAPSERFMQQALELARQAEGCTAPNPPVGAVLVKDGRVVGEGFHPGAGQPHAEIFALRQAGAAARGADLYVTLEPCCHQGRTGPCSDALITAGVASVHIGATDPNPEVSGQGILRLREAGIAVSLGPLEDACRQLIAPFAKYITTGQPLVLFKAAMTLDGRIATLSGDSRWISCDKSRELVHATRSRVDGILVGSGTVLADNPRLTTRLRRTTRNAARIVIDGGLQTSPQAEVYSRQAPARRILVTADHHPEAACRPFAEQGVEIVRLACRDGCLDMDAVMSELARRDIMFLLLEGGGRLAGAMLRAGLIDQVMLFIAPLLLGGDDGKPLLAGNGAARIGEAWRLADMRVSRIDRDLLVEGKVLSCSPD